MAGLWDVWRSPEGEELRTFSVLTTDANDFMRGVPIGLLVGSIGGGLVGFGIGGEAWVPARIPR